MTGIVYNHLSMSITTDIVFTRQSPVCTYTCRVSITIDIRYTTFLYYITTFAITIV